MRNARDSFLQFLKDNLNSAIPIHAMRKESDNPNADQLELNAVNIKFTNPDFNNQVSDQSVLIDVIHQDELTALDWTQQVWALLSTRFYTPMYDYTIPASPVDTGYVLFWPSKLRFREIASPYYSHLRCRTTLSFHF